MNRVVVSLGVTLGRLAVLVLAAAAGSCGTSGEANPNLQNLDRPTDIAFSCYGKLRITNGQPADATQPIEFIPQPLESCRLRSLAHVNVADPPTPAKYQDVPAGQEDLTSDQFLKAHAWYAFILQSVPGTVAVAEAQVKKPDEGYIAGEIAVQDATPLTPGKNSLSVGSLPIAIAGDAAGCHMITANAGSCDLSIIDAARAIERTDPAVRQQSVTTPSGAPVLAKPAAMLASEEIDPIGVECPADPTGLVYIAYPDCHAVAAVRPATGKVEASIRFADDGTATLGDGELSCPAECRGEAVTDGARPVTLDVVRDDRVGNIRLAIGLDNRPVVTVVDLDPTWLPHAVKQVELTGDVGVTDIAISPQIGVGGKGPDDDAPGTDQAQFVYGVATDGSVRVAEVYDTDTECDTQIDPHYLLDTADAAQLTCIPVDVPGGPPRRAGAEGPGIRIPGDAVPVSVKIVRAGLDSSQAVQVDPLTLIGTFAFVGLSSGVVAVVNVDDDNYDDLQLTASDPFTTQLPLAMPHQLRDSYAGRSDRATTTKDNVTGPVCLSNPEDPAKGPPRASDPPTQVIRAASISVDKAASLPFFRQVDCMGLDGRSPVSELSINAPDDVRLETYPDWRGLNFDEAWSLTWQGTLSGDTTSTAIDGPAVREGYVEVAGGGIKVHDAARPFCELGVEDRDTVILRGCDPSRGDAQCGPGQTCYVHPDSTQASGACLPKDQLSDLVGPCRDFLISSRKFAVKRAFADNLELIERRKSLRTTPVTGCTSADQCQMLATYEDSLKSDADPVDDMTPASTRTFACEVDPSRPAIGGQELKRCVQTCTASDQCGAGGRCSGGYCIEAPVPPPQCVVGVQRYELQASDAFVVLGSVSGYQHPITEDAATGRCVKDPDASPLLLGRIPLTAPPCTSDDPGSVTPNPCSTQVQETDEEPVFAAGSCHQPGTEIRTRTATAIRFRNAGMTINLVDPTYPGDARCNGDRGGSLVGVPRVYDGYQIGFHQIAGFSTEAVANLRASYLARMVVGPDRAIWVVDEGDVLNTLVNARGGIYRFTYDPSPLGGGYLIR